MHDMQMSKDNFVESVLTFCFCVALGIELRSPGSSSQHLYLLSHLEFSSD